ncbi:hypothetical protein ABLG96_10455 [Nakamurella sp. A5-74]|uniref:XRE family transcriptional regulator n=1 Tax=Nakamurella sp. A5-74 TaxID=3158264 RepID=A0AAU8DU31_9ACTN
MNHSTSTVADEAIRGFDFDAFFAALDQQRRHHDLNWYELADQLWDQSSDLNAVREDHPLCGGAVSRLGRRGKTSCQYAMFMLRWLDRAPEEFLEGGGTDAAAALPPADPAHRLRWDLAELHGAVDTRRCAQGLTWTELGRILGCTPNRLTNLRSARECDLDLAMRAAQWTGHTPSAYIHPASW